jgi:hypothetical protein
VTAAPEAPKAPGVGDASTREGEAPIAAAASPSPSPERTATLTPPPPLLRSIDISAGAGALTQAFFGNSDSPMTGVWVTGHASVRLGSLARAGVLAGASTATTRAAVLNAMLRGTAQSIPFTAAAEGGVCTTLGVELCASALAGVRGARGTSSGPLIYQKGDVYLVRPEVGLLGRAKWSLKAGFFLAAEAWAAFPLGGGALEVEKIPSATLPLPLLDFTAALLAGWSFQIL